MSSHAESGPGQRGPSQPAHEQPWSPRPGQPFLRRGAQQAGISDDHLAGPGFRAIFRGVHVTAEVPITLTLRAQAALTAAPAGAMISHHTAAKLWGGVVPDTSAVHQFYQAAGVLNDRFALPPGQCSRPETDQFTVLHTAEAMR